MKIITIESGGKYNIPLTFRITEHVLPTLKSILEKALKFYEDEGGFMGREFFIESFLSALKFWNVSNESEAYNIISVIQLAENIFDKQWGVLRYYAKENDIEGLIKAIESGAETPAQTLLLMNEQFCGQVCDFINELPSRIFTDDINFDIVRSIITGNGSPYKLVSNSLAAALFGNLAELGLIPFQWAKKIGDNQVLRSSHGDNILTARDLTSAWSRVRGSDKKEYRLLREGLRSLYKIWKDK